MDEHKLRVFYEKRMGAEVEADSLGDEWKGYVVRVSGGNDKQGFPMKQGVLTNSRVRLLLSKGHSCYRPRRDGERKRKSVRGCIVDANLSVLALVIIRKGENEIPGLTDTTVPRRLGPKRASKIRKLFNLSKEDDVRQFVVKRPLPAKEGKAKPRFKAPKIQRLITPVTLQRKRHRLALKKARRVKKKEQAADYAKLLAQRQKEAKVRRQEELKRRRSASMRDSGVPGCGFLNHAINLYLRYKPRVEELHQFLEFQLPRQWAPVYSDLPLGPQRKRQSSASLPVNLIGPKLYVCTNMVDVGKRPVTGLRLFLEGQKSNKLAIHLQHLCSLPQIIQLEDDTYNPQTPEAEIRKYYEPIGSWKRFSHVCTAPVDSDDSSIVTGAHLEVVSHGFKKILFLRLHFSKVCNATSVKNPEWDGSPNLGQKSGLISTLISTHFSTAALKPAPRPAEVNINSAVYPGGPPVPVQTPKLLRFVDTTEMLRGPQDLPGYWVVSGAKLHLERGKISLRVKYSLLTVNSPDDEFSPDEEF